MISTDALQVGFLSSLTIVNEGSLLTIVYEGSSLTIIVNETTSFIKTIVLKNDRLKNNHFEKTTILKNELFKKNDRF